jgi:hypothetical protein
VGGSNILPQLEDLEELVRRGMCWWFRKYAPIDEVLNELEKSAWKLRIWKEPTSSAVGV